MAGILGDLVKGLSELAGNADDPELKIFTAKTEIAEVKKQMEAVYAKVGKAVMESEKKADHPAEAEELTLLNNKLAAIEETVASAEKAKQEAAAAANTCPSCGSVNSEGTRFCTNCGNEIRPQKLFCPNCGGEITKETKFCPSCGNKVGE